MKRYTYTVIAFLALISNPFFSIGQDSTIVIESVFGSEGICRDPAGNIYVGDGASKIKKIDPITGLLYNFAGTATPGYSGDGGPDTNATLNINYGLCSDNSGNIYIADYINAVIRKVNSATGIITTFTGGGTSGADGVLASSASGMAVRWLVSDARNNIYLGEGNHIRKIDAVTNLITTVYVSGGGSIAVVTGFAVDGSKNLYLADSNTIKKVNMTTGAISIVAGNGVSGYTGDGGQATSSQVEYVEALCISAAGDIFFSEGRGSMLV